MLGEALGQGGEWRRRGLDHRENGTYIHFRVPWRGWRATATESRVSQRQSVRRPQRSAVPAVSSKLAATRRCRRHLRPNRRLAENVPTVFRPQLKAKPLQAIHIPGETDSPCGGERRDQISAWFSLLSHTACSLRPPAKMAVPSRRLTHATRT